MFTFFHITVFNWMDQKIRKRKRKDFFDIPNIFLWKKVDIIITHCPDWHLSSSLYDSILHSDCHQWMQCSTTSHFIITIHFPTIFFSLLIVKMKWFLIDFKLKSTKQNIQCGPINHNIVDVKQFWNYLEKKIQTTLFVFVALIYSFINLCIF